MDQRQTAPTPGCREASGASVVRTILLLWDSKQLGLATTRRSASNLLTNHAEDGECAAQ